MMIIEKTDSKGNRLFKGERERSDGRYEYRYTDHRGIKHSIYESRLHQLRLEEAKIAFREQKNILLGLKELHLNDVYEMWIGTKSAIKDNTKKGYQQIYDTYVRNGLGKRNIEEIRSSDVKMYYTSLKCERCLSVETICRIQNVLFQVFQYAVDSDVIWKNPATLATKGLKRNHPKRVSTRSGINESEAKKLTDFIYAAPEFRHWYPVVYVLIHTGMRLCEFVSLRWCDVNMTEKYIDINHNMVYYAKPGEQARYHVSDGSKTISGMRKIPFDNSVAEAFELERSILRNKGIQCTQEIEGYTDFVFLNENGKAFGQSSINRALMRIVDAYNSLIGEDDKTNPIPHLSCHCLRHTYATILYERGVGLKVMQKLLGHSDVSTTMDIYTGVSDEYVFEEYRKKLDPENV